MNVALCLHDWREPPVTGPLTADFVYVRRHGTRRRYGGAYTETMLAADAERVAGWTRGGRDTYVYFKQRRSRRGGAQRAAARRAAARTGSSVRRMRMSGTRP